MISVLIKRDKTGNVTGFDCRGHAGYAESGQDIVCAAVSMLVINTINALDSLTTNAIKVESDEEEGSIALTFEGAADSEGRLLVDALILGLESVREEYGKEFLRMEDGYA